MRRHTAEGGGWHLAWGAWKASLKIEKLQRDRKAQARVLDTVGEQRQLFSRECPVEGERIISPVILHALTLWLHLKKGLA